MICMIGKDTRRRAFAAAIAFTAGAIGLFLILGTALAGILLLGGEEEAKSGEEADTAVLKQQGLSLYDPGADGEVIRLHIVANSDSSEDQRVKMLVRNEVLALAQLSDDIMTPKNAAAAEGILKKAGEPLLSAVRRVLEREGAGYDAQLVLGDFDFPGREYDGKLYPAGSYRALRIILGSGEGKNWWCVLFPPLCIIKTDEPFPGSAAARAEGADNRSSDGAEQSAPPRLGEIRFESLIVRLFRKIFQGEITE